MTWFGLQLFRAIIMGLLTFGQVRHKTAETGRFRANQLAARCGGSRLFFRSAKWHAYVM